MNNKLRLSLDSMFQSEYYYTEYDIGNSGHNIIIEKYDREAFLDAFAAEWRERADDFLEEMDDEDEEDE